MGLKMIGGIILPQGQLKINKPPRYATMAGMKDVCFTTSDKDLTVNMIGSSGNGTWVETDLTFNNGVTNYYWEIETYAAPANDRNLVVGILGRNPTSGSASYPENAPSMRYNNNASVHLSSSGSIWLNSGEGNGYLYWNDTIPTRLMFAFNTTLGEFYVGNNGTWIKGATSASIAAGSTTGGISIEKWSSADYRRNWDWRPIVGNNNVSSDNKTWSATTHFDPKFHTYEPPAGFEPVKES